MLVVSARAVCARGVHRSADLLFLVSLVVQSFRLKMHPEYVAASGVGYRRWAEHQRNFVLLRLAQDREAVVGEEHPDACSNPAGCVHATPCCK